MAQEITTLLSEIDKKKETMEKHRRQAEEHRQQANVHTAAFRETHEGIIAKMREAAEKEGEFMRSVTSKLLLYIYFNLQIITIIIIILL